MKRFPIWILPLVGTYVIVFSAIALLGSVPQNVIIMLFCLSFVFLWCGLWLLSNWIKGKFTSSVAKGIALFLRSVVIVQAAIAGLIGVYSLIIIFIK